MNIEPMISKKKTPITSKKVSIQETAEQTGLDTFWRSCVRTFAHLFIYLFIVFFKILGTYSRPISNFISLSTINRSCSFDATSRSIAFV